MAEPDDGDDDDEDAFDEGGDGVGDGRDHREEYKGNDVLAEVEGAVKEKLEGEAGRAETVFRRGQLEREVVRKVGQ